MVSSKKTNLLFISFLVFFGLFLFAQPAHAIFGVGDVGLFDLGMMQLDALDFVDNVILRFVVFIFVLMAESQAFIAIAAALLQWAVGLPINLHNALVFRGWEFVSGLTNLFFILVFIGIALAFILKTETFGMKKALPNLIIIALLINFSLVFVGMIVDIGDISRNALLTSFGKDFVTLAIGPLQQSAGSFILWAAASLTIVLVGAFIPYYNSWVLAAVASLFLSDVATGGVMLRGIMLIILNFVTGGIFFLYFGLFLVRIVIIWMLAIFAPLALFAYILPATKKYFSQWLHYLLSWAFMGIAAVFLIGLGLGLFAKIGGEALLAFGTENINTARGTVPPLIYHYLFLIIYLGVSFFVCKKFVPMGADIIMKQGEALVGKAWGSLKGTRTMGQVAERAAGGLDAAARWGERLQTQGKGLARPLGWLTKRTLSAPIPALTEYGARMRKISVPTGWKQMSLPEKERYVSALRKDQDKLVLASEMKGEKTFQIASKGFQNMISGIQTKFSGDERLKNIYGKEIRDICDALPDKVDKTMYLNLTPAADHPQLERDIKGVVNEITDITGQTITEDEASGILYMRRMKVADLPEATKGSLTSGVGKMASFGMTDRQIQKIYDTFGGDIMDKLVNEPGGINAIFEGKTPEQATDLTDKLYKNNPRLFRFGTQTPAGRAMNFTFAKHMRDLNGKPTNDLDAFEKLIKISDIRNAFPDLDSLYKDLEAADEIKEHIAEARRKKETTLAKQEEAVLNRLQQTIENKENALGPDLKTRWEEIKTLKYPGQKRPPGTTTPPRGGPTPGGGPSPITPQTPRPSGIPSNWVPGPGGIWVPPSSPPRTPPTPGPSSSAGPTWPGGTPPRPRPRPIPPDPYLFEMIDRIKHQKQQGTYKDIGIVVQPGSALHEFLLDNGVTQEEFNKMKTDDVYNKAIEIAERFPERFKK